MEADLESVLGFLILGHFMFIGIYKVKFRKEQLR